MAKMGRPSKYKKEYCDMLIRHMEQGYSFESFAAELRTHNGTLYEWVKQHEDFRETKKIATDLCRKWWEGKAIKHLSHHKDGEQLNSVVWIFNMKNRFGWRNEDPQSTEGTENEEAYPDPTQSDNQSPGTTSNLESGKNPS